MTATDYAFWGVIVHLTVDWLLQNHWQSIYKVSLKHPAAYVHSGLHFLGLLLVFPWFVALFIAITHILIDTRKPLQWWRKTIRQTTDPNNPATIHVAFWTDQVAHILVIALVSLALYR